MAIKNRFASENFVTEKTNIVQNQITTLTDDVLLKTHQQFTDDEIEQIHLNLHTTEYVTNIIENSMTNIVNLLGGIE